MADAATGAAAERPRRGLLVERLVQGRAFWPAVLLPLFAWPIYRSVNRELPPPLPGLHRVPEFSLTDGFGRPFGSDDIRGKVAIASFMFTSCPTTCPALMETMQVVQKRVRGLGRNIALLSFTVDPENDTPRVLHRHARSLGANPHVWRFLTGPGDALRELLVGGFRVPMGDGREPVTGRVGDREVTVWDIVHTGKLVLLDGDRRVRGYYSTDDASVDGLMIDVGLLHNRSAW